MISPQDESEFKTRCDALAATREHWQGTPTCDDLVAMLLIIADDPDLAEAFLKKTHTKSMPWPRSALRSQARPRRNRY